ncbi:MAG: hypothetical protein ABL958_09060, partial [Bdellovibrionia bacterium]
SKKWCVGSKSGDGRTWAKITGAATGDLPFHDYYREQQCKFMENTSQTQLKENDCEGKYLGAIMPEMHADIAYNMASKIAIIRSLKQELKTKFPQFFNKSLGEVFWNGTKNVFKTMAASAQWKLYIEPPVELPPYADLLLKTIEAEKMSIWNYADPEVKGVVDFYLNNMFDTSEKDMTQAFLTPRPARRGTKDHYLGNVIDRMRRNNRESKDYLSRFRVGDARSRCERFQGADGQAYARALVKNVGVFGYMFGPAADQDYSDLHCWMEASYGAGSGIAGANVDLALQGLSLATMGVSGLAVKAGGAATRAGEGLLWGATLLQGADLVTRVGRLGATISERCADSKVRSLKYASCVDPRLRAADPVEAIHEDFKAASCASGVVMGVAGLVTSGVGLRILRNQSIRNREFISLGTPRTGPPPAAREPAPGPVGPAPVPVPRVRTVGPANEVAPQPAVPAGTSARSTDAVSDSAGGLSPNYFGGGQATKQTVDDAAQELSGSVLNNNATRGRLRTTEKIDPSKLTQAELAQLRARIDERLNAVPLGRYSTTSMRRQLNGEEPVDKVVIVTHQNERYAEGTANFLANDPGLKNAPRLLLGSEKFPVPDPRLLAQASAVRYSMEGEVAFNAVPKEVHLAGGWSERCLSRTVGSVMKKFEQSSNETIRIAVHSKLVYSDEGDDIYGSLSDAIGGFKSSQRMYAAMMKARQYMSQSGVEYTATAMPKVGGTPENPTYQIVFTGKGNGKTVVVDILQ